MQKFGDVGDLSNQIKFLRDTEDGNWTLIRDIEITAVIRRSRARGGAGR